MELHQDGYDHIPIHRITATEQWSKPAEELTGPIQSTGICTIKVLKSHSGLDNQIASFIGKKKFNEAKYGRMFE